MPTDAPGDLPTPETGVDGGSVEQSDSASGSDAAYGSVADGSDADSSDAANGLDGWVYAPTTTSRTGSSTTYPTTYSDWEDGFMAGNGKRGIIVFGNPLKETVVFNDRGFNVAQTNPRSFNQISATDLATIAGDTIAGNYGAGDTLAANAPGWVGGGEGNRHPGYEMLITIPPSGAVSNYSRTTNYRTGEISVNWTDSRGAWVRKAFVSRGDDVVVQYLTPPAGQTLSCTIQLTTDPAMQMTSGMVYTDASTAQYLNMRVLYPSGTNGAGYEGVTRVVLSGGTSSISGGVLSISDANSVILLSRTAKYYSNAAAAWASQPLQGQLAAIGTDYNTLLKDQIATHEAIYDRVALDLNADPSERMLTNDKLLAMQAASPTTPVKALWERVFDAGRYHFLSSSSNATPPDLLGIWTGDFNAGWGGFYTLDANLNLQIAGGNIGDMPEAMAGYFAILQGWQKDFETNATKLLGCRGMLSAGNTPGTTTGLEAQISNQYPYQYATGEMGWLLYPFWEHYLITGDKAFLRNQAYPLFKDMGYFYEDFLKQTDSSGHYVFAGSVSPENQPSGLGISLVNNSTFDISGAKFSLSTLIKISNLLGLDQGPGGGVETWTAILNKLPPYEINSDGALAEWAWPGLRDNYNHRHSSQMLGVWPFREITPENDMAMFNAAVGTLSKKDQYNYENAGHGLLHAALNAANLKNAQSLTNHVLTLMSQGFYYSGLASSHYNGHNVFCTDTANAMPGILMEMLVSSSPGVVELLPALPAALDQGTVWGVKARSQLTVEEMTWNTSTGSIEVWLGSDIDQDITVIVRRGIASISSATPTGSSSLGNIARVVHLKAGMTADVTIGMAHSDAGP
jgi:hypothetical protein